MFGARNLVTLLSVATLIASLGVAGCSSVSPDPGPGPDPEPGEDGQNPPPPPPEDPVGLKMLVHTSSELYTVDDLNFELDYVGPFGVDENITDLAVTPDGRVFGISGESLYEINVQNGSATFVAAVAGDLNVGLTFLPNGQLLATDKSGAVREIAPDTGEVTEIGKFGNGWRTAGDLVAISDGTMFAIGEEQYALPGDSNLLLTVDTGTGEAQYVGELGYGSVYGSAFANGKVYAFTDAGEIIEVDPVSGQGQLVETHADVAFWGAAVTPLVQIE